MTTEASLLRRLRHYYQYGEVLGDYSGVNPDLGEVLSKHWIGDNVVVFLPDTAMGRWLIVYFRWDLLRLDYTCESVTQPGGIRGTPRSRDQRYVLVRRRTEEPYNNYVVTELLPRCVTGKGKLTLFMGGLEYGN